MIAYQLKNRISVFTRPGEHSLSEAIHKAVQAFLHIIEADGKSNTCLDQWANTLGNGAIYITFSRPTLGLDHTWIEYQADLVVESKDLLALSDSFEECQCVDPDSYDQVRDLYANDATADCDMAFCEWKIDETSLIILKYELVEGNAPDYPPHFSMHTYLCNDSPAAKPTDIFYSK